MTYPVHDMAAEIVHREGGYVNDPDDPGGATNRGITIHTARALGLDLDGDGDVDIRDVQKITVSLAIDIYIRQYFKKPRIAQLPDALHDTVFDMHVNAGSNAFRILQSTLNDTGLNFDLAVDGVIGPMTIRAAHQAAKAMGGEMLRDAYGIERRKYYYQLGDRRPKSRKYAKRRDGGKGGWITRAEEFMRPKYHLSDAEHDARTAAWR